MIRVVFSVRRGGAGNGPAWWAAFALDDLEIVGEGSGRTVRIRREAAPRWLPRPRGQETYISRARGTRVDGEAWVDLPPGTLLRCGATCAGGLRCARVASPVLIVAEGAVWEAEDHDGTRWVGVQVNGARPLTLAEAERLLARTAVSPDEPTTRGQTLLPP